MHSETSASETRNHWNSETSLEVPFLVFWLPTPIPSSNMVTSSLSAHWGGQCRELRPKLRGSLAGPLVPMYRAAILQIDRGIA